MRHKKIPRTTHTFYQRIKRAAKQAALPRQKPLRARAKQLPGTFRVTDDPEELERVTGVVCLPDGSGEFFADDVRAHCARCGRGIHHRPHVPKRPPKLCLDCALNAAQDGAADDWQHALNRASKHVDQRGKERGGGGRRSGTGPAQPA